VKDPVRLRRVAVADIQEATMKRALLAAALAAFGTPALTHSPAQAANADAPYSNVDRSNDAGNNTGDSRVDTLNAGQLNRNYKGPLELRQPSQGRAQGSAGTTAPPPQPGTQPPIAPR
jgi:hypothetical protein